MDVFGIFILIMLVLFAISMAYLVYDFYKESEKYDADAREFMAFIEKAKYDHEHRGDEGKHEDS